tara:strand:+ start:204 stop:542 length:339 start_codon:yes stop_codon:yes gene_type:complete
MEDLWQTQKKQHTIIKIAKLVRPKIYVGNRLIWLNGKSILGKKRTVVLAVSKNNDKFHATLINESNEKFYLCVQTDEPINNLKENQYNKLVVEIFEKIVQQLDNNIGIQLKA